MIFYRRFVCSGGLLLCMLFAAPWVMADGFTQGLADARQVFIKGADGDKRAVRRALQRFRELAKQYPGNYVVAAYIGACFSLKGRDAARPIEKQRFTESAVQRLNNILENLPEESRDNLPLLLEAKLVIADTFVHIPKFFKRYALGKQLIRAILAHDGFSAMDAGFQSTVYLTAAMLSDEAGRSEEYKRYLTQVVERDRDGRNGRKATALLQQR